MNPIDLPQMADIFIPSPPHLPISMALLLLLVAVGVLLLLSLVLLFWFYLKSPLVKLESQLKQDNLSSRDAAHQLALILEKKPIKLEKIKVKTNLYQQVNHLRFQRELPNKKTLLVLIKKARYVC